MTEQLISGQSSSGRYFRIAVTDSAIAVWLSPIEIDDKTYGGDDDVITTSLNVKNIDRAEALARVIEAVTNWELRTT